MEEWRVIPRFPDYEASDLGSVRRKTQKAGTRAGRVKHPTVTKNGYMIVNIEKKPRKVHALILESFVGPRPEKHDACHNDGNRLNNVLTNLRWATRKENMADARAHGTDCHGERHPFARLTWATVREIRKLWWNNSFTQQQIADCVGATKSQVGDITRNTSWVERE